MVTKARIAVFVSGGGTNLEHLLLAQEAGQLPHGEIVLVCASNESAYYTQFAVKCFRTYLCMMPLATVNKGTFIYLQSLGKAVASTLISLVREVVFGVGFALLLPLFFGLDGVLYSMPVSDILTFIISAIVIVFTCKSLKMDPSEGSGR